jgi:hypothetical protein
MPPWLGWAAAGGLEAEGDLRTAGSCMWFVGVRARLYMRRAARRCEPRAPRELKSMPEVRVAPRGAARSSAAARRGGDATKDSGHPLEPSPLRARPHEPERLARRLPLAPTRPILPHLGGRGADKGRARRGWRGEQAGAGGGAGGRPAGWSGGVAKPRRQCVPAAADEALMKL